VHENTPNHYSVRQTVATMTSARTMEIDSATHRLFTVGAQFGPAPAAAPGARRQRPPMIPGTFTLLVLQN
jgi:hypothetical protein